MIIASSALLAVLLNEPERGEFVAAMLDAPCRICAAALVEAGIVADRRSPALGRGLDRLIEKFDIEIVPLDARHAAMARRAHLRYGRGSGSPARLNLGDCLTYALAADTGDELLFKGDDFLHTDLLLALTPPDPESI